jgi:hypothetical protein
MNISFFIVKVEILMLIKWSYKVEGAKSNTPSKTNTYKRLPITNTLLP